MPKTIPQLDPGTIVTALSLFESVEGGVSVSYTGDQLRTFISTNLLSSAVAAATYQTIANVPVLAVDTTFYVRTDGNDSNTGLANTAGGAWLTIQHALNAVTAYVIRAGVVVTIQIGDGTYNAANIARRIIGGGSIVINGNSGTPGNVIVQGGATSAFTFEVMGYTIQNMELRSTSAHCILVSDNGVLRTGVGLRFGAAGANHFRIGGGQVLIGGNYSIVGAAARHIGVSRFGQFLLLVGGLTVTVTGTPAFSVGFAVADDMGLILQSSASLAYSGGATGIRYISNRLSLINTGGGANYFPGNVAGSTADSGLYL